MPQLADFRSSLRALRRRPGLTAAMLQNAYGDKLATLEAARKQHDPANRLLNDYFRTLLT